MKTQVETLQPSQRPCLQPPGHRSSSAASPLWWIPFSPKRETSKPKTCCKTLPVEWKTLSGRSLHIPDRKSIQFRIKSVKPSFFFPRCLISEITKLKTAFLMDKLFRHCGPRSACHTGSLRGPMRQHTWKCFTNGSWCVLVLKLVIILNNIHSSSTDWFIKIHAYKHWHRYSGFQPS